MATFLRFEILLRASALSVVTLEVQITDSANLKDVFRNERWFLTELGAIHIYGGEAPADSGHTFS